MRSLLFRDDEVLQWVVVYALALDDLESTGSDQLFQIINLEASHLDGKAGIIAAFHSRNALIQCHRDRKSLEDRAQFINTGPPVLATRDTVSESLPGPT